jgi:hypothetical protein
MFYPQKPQEALNQLVTEEEGLQKRKEGNIEESKRG